MAGGLSRNGAPWPGNRALDLVKTSPGMRTLASIYCPASDLSAHGAVCCQPGNIRPRALRLAIYDNEQMIIPEEHIDDFIKRWENAFNETLTREDARIKAMELLELYKMIGRRPAGEEPTAWPTGEERMLGS